MNSDEFLDVLASELDAAMLRRLGGTRPVGVPRSRCRWRCRCAAQPGAAWSPRRHADVVADITSGRVAYVVAWETGDAVVRVTGDGRLEALGPDGRPGGLAVLPTA